MKITVFPDDEKNVSGGFVQDLEFSEIAEMFSECHQGGKHDGYFVRGELNPVYRKDANLASSDLLVLDGDASLDDNSSAPSPLELHKILKRWKINHFIYTSHSHNPPEKNKFRCVIECPMPSKEYLKPTAKEIVDKLNEEGYPLLYVKEMGVWSQPWFIPRRDDPNDGKFEYYCYTKGSSYRAFVGESSEASRASEKVAHTEYAERIRQITSGENYHDNIVALSWGYYRDGMHRSNIISTIRGLLDTVPVKDSRWQSRYDEVERIVDGAISKTSPKEKTEDDIEYAASDVEVPDLSEVEAMSEWTGTMPMPPGLLGKLVQSAWRMQRYQYEEVAFVSALGLVAGICGRKFNISDTGLNIYLTLIMGTGMGKDSISEFIEHALLGLNVDSINTQPLSFLGAGRFTGPTGVLKSLKNARSQICVFTEAGLLLRSKAGDNDGLTRVLLSLYTCSGANRITKKEVFSKSDDSVEQIQSPALSIVNEATPDTLLKAFKAGNSIEVGDLPRQSIFRVARQKPFANRHRVKHINEDCLDKLSVLTSICSQIQATNDPEVIELDTSEIADDIFEHDDKWSSAYNTHRDIDSVKANMASRMHLKALKFAALATVFNHNDYVVRSDEWEWAKSMVQYEFDGLTNFFAGSGGISGLEQCIMIVAKAIVKMLDGKYKSVKQGMDARYRKAGIVTRSALRQALKNNAKLAEFDTTKFGKIVTGVDVTIDSMLEFRYLAKITDPFESKTECLKVTETFPTIWMDYT